MASNATSATRWPPDSTSTWSSRRCRPNSPASSRDPPDRVKARRLPKDGMRRRTNASSPPHSTAPLVVLGLGPVGLVTAAGLARLGATVIGVDTDTAKIGRLVRDGVTIHEPGL